MPVSSWSTTPANNNSAPPNGAPEGMAPASVNDTIRQIMADVRTFWDYLGRAVKAANTARTSTTTLTDDADLLIAIPIAGTWLVKAKLFVEDVGGAQGFKFAVPYTGTVTYARGELLTNNLTGGSMAVTVPTSATTDITTSTFSESALSATPVIACFTIEFAMAVTTTGNIKVQWAQNSSSASSTTLLKGSYMTVARLL